MALSNKERQKKWFEKNRALHNFRRRKKNLPVPVLAEPDRVSTPDEGEARESTIPESGKSRDGRSSRDADLDSCGGQNDLGSGLSGGNEVADVIHSLPPAQTSQDTTLEKLRGLMKVEQEKPAVEVPAKPKMVRTETGMLVPDEVWQEREEYKRKSREKGFVPDEYSQA